jgi:hypothetical protein
MRVFGAWYALEIAEKQWHGLFRVDEVDNLLILPALFHVSFNYRLVVIRALGESLSLEHVSYACLAKGASTLMQDCWDSLIEVEGVPTIVTEKQVVHFL